MDVLVSDRARAEISKAVKHVLCHLCIDDWQSEPHYHHQNPAGQRYHWVKTACNRVMNTTGAPDYVWLLALQYVCFVQKGTAKETLKWRTPFKALAGSTPDISAILHFHFGTPSLSSLMTCTEESTFPQNPMRSSAILWVSWSLLVML